MEKISNNHILQYREELKTILLYFVGSITYYAQYYINLALEKRGLKSSCFLKISIDNLIHKIEEEIF